MKSDDPHRFDPAVLQTLGRLDLIAKVIVNGLRQGQHRSHRRGFSTEFSDFNPYTPGDDLRFLDWRLYARTDRLFTKRFEAETNLEVTLMLDATASMAWSWQQSIDKLRYGINLLAALACLHMRQNDLVGLLVHDARDLHHLPPRSRRSHLDAMFATLDGVQPGHAEAFPRMIDSLAQFRRHRGRLIICSDLEEDEGRIGKSLEAVAGHQDEVIMLHLLHQAEIDLPFDDGATHLRDSETGQLLRVNMTQLRREQAEQVAEFRENWRQRCLTHGMIYRPVHTGQSYVEVIHELFEALHGE